MTITEAMQQALATVDLRIAERQAALELELFRDGLDAANIRAVVQQQRLVDAAWRADLIETLRLALRDGC